MGEAVGMVFLGTVGALCGSFLGQPGIIAGLTAGVKVGATVGGLIPIAGKRIADVFSKRPGN